MDREHDDQARSQPAAPAPAVQRRQRLQASSRLELAQSVLSQRTRIIGAMTDVAPLFRPFRIRGLTLENRIVMAPMTRAHSPGAFPNDDNIGYYARRAAGEVGL